MFSLMVAAALTVGSAHADDSCAQVKVSEDKFTHESTASVKGAIVSRTLYALGWEADFDAGKTKLEFALPMAGVHADVLPPGLKLMLLLDDGSVVSLATTKDTKPVADTTPYGPYTFYSADFPVDKATATTLASQSVTAVRAQLPGGELTWKVNGKQAKLNTRAFACYASMMP